MTNELIGIIEDSSMEVVVEIKGAGPQGEQGEKGEDGYTPIKGVDYFDGEQGEKGEDGYTPVKGIDYFDGEQGEKGEDGYTPVKGVDYFDGEQGEKGDPGDSIEFTWNGTQLGIRQEGETSYQYINLKGDKGDTGDTGNTGKSLEFNWNGTQLGVRVEGNATYQYINLKGDKGDKGDPGVVDYTGLATTTYVDDKVKTDVPVGAKFTDTVYSHPNSHPANIITESSTKRFVSDTKISEWDDKETTTGSQDKANQAEQNAKDYTDQEISSIDIPDSTWESIQNKPDTFVPSEHNHTIGNITDLQNELNSKETPSGSQAKANAAESNAKDYVDSKVKTDVPINAKFTDTVYSHPSSHPASMITESSTKRFVSDSEKSTWNSKSDTDTITTINGNTGAISKADIVALGIPAQDTVYTHPTGTNPHGTTKSDVGLSNVDNVKQMPISGGVLENYREKLVTLSGTSTTIDLSLGNVFAHSLTGNTTYSITNAISGQAHSFTLIITQTATARTLIFPANVKWQDGEIPDMSTPLKEYELFFTTTNGGDSWRAGLGGVY